MVMRTLLNVTFTSTLPVFLNLNFYHLREYIINAMVKMQCQIRQLCILFITDRVNIF